MRNFGRSLFVILLLFSGWALAQDQSAAGNTRAVGTVQSISGNSFELKTDAGAQLTISADSTTRVLRLEPGQKKLSEATAIQFGDIQTGDRTLISGKTSADQKTLAAATIVVMKAGDIASKQQQERQQWARNSVGGLVKSVDPAASTVTITRLVMGQSKDTTVHVSPTTVIRRYAANSVKFENATASTLDAIQPGDQLVARGQHTGDEVTADEIVSGHFPYVSGKVQSVDKATNQITIDDLLTKKPVTVTVGADSQLRKLPEMMAQHLAMFVKGGGQNGVAQGAGQEHRNAAPAAQEAAPGAGQGGGQRAPGGGNGARGGGDVMQMILNRTPSVQLSDLQKGDAVMLVATSGSSTTPPTVITLIAGVEPILTASPKGDASTILSPWNLGGGNNGAAGADAGVTQ
ncbi:MAG TPA: hypothetical protein VGL89_15670 [Candidatus Koribacter sp.]|jgi:hypothetical protein